jgi:hypothetical protein
MNWYRRIWSKWMIPAAVLGFIVLCGGYFFIILVFKPTALPRSVPTAALTVIAFLPTTTPSPTSILPPTTTPTPLTVIDGISVGSYVQISGTEGDGLRMRSAPSITSTQVFLAQESELFLVKDGPKMADDYTWWYLVAPYDQARSGWAVSRYLNVVAPPE